MRKPVLLNLVLTALGMVLLSLGEPRAVQGQASFDRLSDTDRKVLSEKFKQELWPLLSRGGDKNSCVGCHNGKVVSALKFSGDADKDFRMLLRDGFFLKGDAGSLLERVTDSNKKRIMPPPGKGDPWTGTEKKVLASLVDTIQQKSKSVVFRAGAFAMDITPSKFPVSVNGGMTDRQAKGSHDRLHARALVLDDGTTRIALVVCDSCMIPREITDAAKTLAEKATGIPPHRILISATHTHTAPTLGAVFQSDPDADYVKELPGMIAAGIVKATERLAPAKIGWAVAKDDTQVFNRRWKVKAGSSLLTNPFGGTDQVKMNPGYQHPDLLEPAGPIDPDITLLSVQAPDGRPIALLANYSLHYVGGLPALSADYFGAFAEKMRELLGADKSFVGIMSNGTSGNINNVNFSGPNPGMQEPGEQIRIVVDSVAEVAFDAYRTIKHRDWVPLAMAQKEIEVGVRLPTEADVARAKEILDKANKKVLTALPEVYARETVLMAKYPPKVKLVLQAIRVGDLGLVANPCETFVEIGLEIKAKSPLRPTCTIELANGYNGYLPTPEHHALGGYETWRARSSYLEVNASRMIAETLLGLLGEVAKKN